MVPLMGIFFIWTSFCALLQEGLAHGAHLQHQINIADDCTFPFTYGGQKYFDCTSRGSIYHWCSLDHEYSGRWKYCAKDDYAKCAFPFVYMGKVHYSCITDKSVLRKAWCSVTANYDEDGAWKECYSK
ncbi:seminal plasma protein A3-like [Saccopteryx bilineata]|uniref:seminal plasma protein A3-like n=1 Tax=Saccopteryx bilineata TaxID=59482 RepID=UPI00338D5038